MNFEAEKVTGYWRETRHLGLAAVSHQAANVTVTINDGIASPKQSTIRRKRLAIS